MLLQLLNVLLCLAAVKPEFLESCKQTLARAQYLCTGFISHLRNDPTSPNLPAPFLTAVVSELSVVICALVADLCVCACERGTRTQQ